MKYVLMVAAVVLAQNSFAAMECLGTDIPAITNADLEAGKFPDTQPVVVPVDGEFHSVGAHSVRADDVSNEYGGVEAVSVTIQNPTTKVQSQILGALVRPKDENAGAQNIVGALNEATLKGYATAASTIVHCYTK